MEVSSKNTHTIDVDEGWNNEKGDAYSPIFALSVLSTFTTEESSATLRFDRSWNTQKRYVLLKNYGSFFINKIKLLTSGCSFPLVAFDSTQEWFKLIRAVLYASENRVARRPTESCLKMPWNGVSATLSASEGVDNGSQTRCVPLLFSDWAVDVPSPACCLLAWCLNSFWWRNSIEHRVHLWEALSLRLLSWDRTCRFIEPEWHSKRR